MFLESVAWKKSDQHVFDATCLTSLGCSSNNGIQHIAVTCSSFFRRSTVPKNVCVCCLWLCHCWNASMHCNDLQFDENCILGNCPTCMMRHETMFYFQSRRGKMEGTLWQDPFFARAYTRVRKTIQKIIAFVPKHRIDWTAEFSIYV